MAVKHTDSGNKNKIYDNQSISSLKGAERVRKRPAVIFGSDGLEGCEHSFFEILSNSVDEAKEGRGNVIIVTAYADLSIKVEDFAGGIPLDWNEKEQRFNWDLVYCELWAGGKYENSEGGIYSYALGKGLILLFHAGFDPGFPPPFRSSPLRFANVIKSMGGGTIIAAHLGGHAQWDDVERYLTVMDIYLDTAMGFEYFPHVQFLRIVEKHGADKILFASDAPWSNAGREMERLNALPLSQKDKDAILGGNARRILGGLL